MCGICGCDEDSEVLAQEKWENHSHWVDVEANIFAKNEEFAQQNQHYFAEKNIRAFNLMSSPGTGKTTLLAKTVSDLQREHLFAVIVGDQQTDLDAQQLRLAGVKAVQINTGKTCHLDAHAVGHAVRDLTWSSEKTALFIENIGNLVCPAFFNLGEHHRIVLLSVTEGDNKPLKYPEMFRHADLLLITKTDLLPYVDFDVTRCLSYVHRINPRAQAIEVSVKTQTGLAEWYQWLKNTL